ncbi:hypothetical protein [Streptomyces sp. DASNCL29]|uniref:hypothetical protein n=1 Tax=Streptomyces sp. DASNCL29 TaxID=2583819 RepID=UPI00110FB312|nr:hypothetical protein [Streptomyces sp. DASNCL29]TMU98089.1 hypothetical protein FGK60_09685 [Streptomyces sp. DASNCL29]
MAVKVEVPKAVINGSVDVPLVIRVGDVADAVVGSLTLRIRDGEVEDWRPVLAAALREVADETESLPDPSEEVDDAAP